MDATIEFLWNRRTGGRPQREASDWACLQLERGHESEALLLLGADSRLDSQEQESLVGQCLRDLRLEHLLDRTRLAAAYEQEMIEDYYAGVIDGWSLILRGCELYYETGEADARRFWIVLANDADQHGGQGICLTYRFNTRPFDEVLAAALAANGFPRRHTPPLG